VLANSFFFLGLAVMPLSEATALFFIAPIVITMFSVIFLGETVGKFRWSATAIGLLGAIIMLRPTSAGFQPLAILPIMAAVCYAGIHMLARHMGDTERASTLSVYIQCVFLVVCLGMGMMFGGGDHAPGDGGALDFLLRAWVIPPREDIPLLLLIGLSSAVGGFCVSQAYRVSEAAVIAPFEYVALVMSIIWGVTIFGTLPDMTGWTGIGLILASGLIVFWREAMLNRRHTSNAYRQR
jgi:drug/metabolite transporter (DMT)-like permease